MSGVICHALLVRMWPERSSLVNVTVTMMIMMAMVIITVVVMVTQNRTFTTIIALVKIKTIVQQDNIIIKYETN